MHPRVRRALPGLAMLSGIVAFVWLMWPSSVVDSEWAVPAPAATPAGVLLANTVTTPTAAAPSRQPSPSPFARTGSDTDAIDTSSVRRGVAQAPGGADVHWCARGLRGWLACAQPRKPTCVQQRARAPALPPALPPLSVCACVCMCGGLVSGCRCSLCAAVSVCAVRRPVAHRGHDVQPRRTVEPDPALAAGRPGSPAGVYFCVSAW
jgi:hypothetical protein